MSVFRVVSVGDLVADIVIRIPHLPVEADCHQLVEGSSQIEPGGAGNFLIAGARLGMDISALGVMGDDAFGKRILQILAEEKVRVDLVELQAEGTTTLVYVLIDRAGGHVFLGEHGVGPAVAFSDAWKRRIDRADAVQTWGYAFQEERLFPIMMDVMTYARAKGRLLLFDPGPHLHSMPFDQRIEILKQCQILLLTEEEIEQFTMEGKVASVARELLAYGLQMVCVKQGARGCVIYTRDETVCHPGYPVDMVDTTAAGDSFAAAFIFAYLSKWGLAPVAAYANAMGAAKVRKLGSGRQVPTLGEVEQVLKEFDTVRGVSR